MFCCKELEMFSLNTEIALVYTPRFRDWGISYIDGTNSLQQISYCPWCGKRLPANLAEEWFEEIDRLKLEPGDKNIPEVYKTDKWYKDINLYQNSDWYLNPLWDVEIKKRFFDNLDEFKSFALRIKYLLTQAMVLKRVNISEAKDLLNKALLENPQNFHAYKLILLNLGDIYFEEGNYLKAEDFYRKLYYHKDSFPRGSGELRSGVKLLKTILASKQSGKYSELIHIIEKFDTELEFLKADKFECLYFAALFYREIGDLKLSKVYAAQSKVLLDKPSPTDTSEIKYGELEVNNEVISTLDEMLKG